MMNKWEGNIIKTLEKLINLEIGLRLKRIRNYYQLSQNEFAKKINVAQTTIAAFETGERRLKDIYVDAIYFNFKVNPIWLKTG